MRILDHEPLDILNKPAFQTQLLIDDARQRLIAHGASDIRFDLVWELGGMATPALFFMREETREERITRVKREINLQLIECL